MARNISDLLREADEIIEKKASKKPSSPSVDPGDDIFKLAEALKSSGKEAPSTDEWSLQEKLAHALMLVGTFANLPELKKLAAFEEKAIAAGCPKEKIGEFLEKKASFERLTSISDLVPWIEE